MSEFTDKSKLMAFVHEELDDSETRAFAQLMSQDEQVRAEVESLLESSQALSSYYSIGTSESLNPQQIALIRKKAGVKRTAWMPWLFFGTGLAAAGLALALFLRLDTQPTQSPLELALRKESAPQQVIKPDQAQSGEVDSFGAARGARVGGLSDVAKRQEPPIAPAPSQAKAKRSAPNERESEIANASSDELVNASAEEPTQATAEKYADAEADMSDAIMDAAPAPAASAGAAALAPAAPVHPTQDALEDALDAGFAAKKAKVAAVTPKIHVNSQNSTVAPNLSRADVIRAVQAAIEGNTSCVPPASGLKQFAFIADLSTSGAITSVRVEPAVKASAEIARCLKMKLQDHLHVLRPSTPAPARITIQLELR